jgi:hypothetical protein
LIADTRNIFIEATDALFGKKFKHFLCFHVNST